MVCTITEMLCVIAYQSIERNTGTTFLTTSVPCYMMLHSLTSNFWVKVWSHDQPSDSYFRLCPRKPILWAQTYITWFTWYEQLAPIHLVSLQGELQLSRINWSWKPFICLFVLLFEWRTPSYLYCWETRFEQFQIFHCGRISMAIFAIG